MHAPTMADIQTRRLTCLKESTDDANRVGFKRRRSFPDPRRQTRCPSIMMQKKVKSSSMVERAFQQRVRTHHRSPVNAQRVEQAHMGSGLGHRRRIGRHGRAQVAETRHYRAAGAREAHRRRRSAASHGCPPGARGPPRAPACRAGRPRPAPPGQRRAPARGCRGCDAEQGHGTQRGGRGDELKPEAEQRALRRKRHPANQDKWQRKLKKEKQDHGDGRRFQNEFVDQ